MKKHYREFTTLFAGEGNLVFEIHNPSESAVIIESIHGHIAVERGDSRVTKVLLKQGTAVTGTRPMQKTIDFATYKAEIRTGETDGIDLPVVDEVWVIDNGSAKYRFAGKPLAAGESLFIEVPLPAGHLFLDFQWGEVQE